MQIPKIYNSREISPIIRSISLFCLALLVITATTAIVWLVFTSLITVPTSDDVAALHDVRAWPKPWAGIKPEPVENITFIFVLILSVICIGLAAYLSTSDLGKRLLLKVSPFIDLSVIAITSAAIVLWFWWMDWTSLVPPSPSGLLIAIRMYPLGFAGSIFFLVTESRVAKSLSSASCLLLVKELNKVVLPAFVYPTKATSLFLLFFLE